MNEDIPINIMTVDKTEIKPFLPKGHIFIKEKNDKWLINWDKIPELFLYKPYRQYEKWFNWYFNNPCICPFMFIGEKEYPINTYKDLIKW